MYLHVLVCRTQVVLDATAVVVVLDERYRPKRISAELVERLRRPMPSNP